MVFTVRRATLEDLPEIQACNQRCLPENYSMKYHVYHTTLWPDLTFVATVGGHVVAYVMGKLNDEDKTPQGDDRLGHISSIAVDAPYRGLGLGSRLMEIVMDEIRDRIGYVGMTLHVRESNRHAQVMYFAQFGFVPYELEEKYYLNKEDAISCRYYFDESRRSELVARARELGLEYMVERAGRKD